MNPNTSSVFMELSESKPNKTRFWVIHAWKVMLLFVFILLSRICQKRFSYITTLPKNMINTIFVNFAKAHLEQLTIPIFMRTTFVARTGWTVLIWNHFNLISLIFCIFCWDLFQLLLSLILLSPSMIMFLSDFAAELFFIHVSQVKATGFLPKWKQA